MPLSGRQPTPRSVRTYGWVPDLPDNRDLQYSKLMRAIPIPPSTDLTPKMPPVYDQGNLGSCTANAIAGALEFDQSTPFWTPSRLFVYFNERVIEGTVNSDSGAMLRDGIKSVSSQGVCKEDEWPYVISKFEVQPFQQCYTDALSYVATSYHSLNQDITEFKSCLAEGFPFVYGFTAYDAFESASVAQTGVLNMPAPTERVVGGHAVLAVGYDDPSQRFIVRNSWGADWGNAGYFTVPYDYLLDPNLASDFWTIRSAGAAGN